jgi:hypothetical protein
MISAELGMPAGHAAGAVAGCAVVFDGRPPPAAGLQAALLPAAAARWLALGMAGIPYPYQ